MVAPEHRVELSPTVDELINKYCIPATVALIILVMLYKLRNYYKSPRTWFTLFAVVFVLGCGGGVYVLLHGVPLYYVRTGRYGEIIDYEYISKGV